MKAPTSTYVPELTGIRAIGAFGVLLTHAAFWTGNYTDDWTGRLNGRFEIGVTIFFVLSAFLLTGRWFASPNDGHASPPSLRKYFISRAKRVLPAYWIVVTAAFLIHASDNPPPAAGGISGWLRTMSFTQTVQFGWIHPGLSQMWSMVVEVGFYVVLPLVGLALWTVTKDRLRPGPVLAIIIGFGAIGPIWTVLSHQQDLLPVVSRLWPMAYFDWFAIGMLLAYGRKVGWRVNLVGSWLVSLALFLLATTTQVGPATLVPDDVNQALWKTTIYGLSAGVFVAPIALGAEVKWLRHPAMIWLGEISYEFFLIHVLVMDWTMKIMGYQTFQGSMFAVAVVTAVVTIPLAWLLRRVTDVITRRPGPDSPWADYSSSSSGPSSSTSTSCATFMADRAAGAPQ
ncbi:MAG: acyltransferase [Corynebacterium sp.]|uniref:acyltransferase family protein n=1 Tax=Corynebacterium sp. TaxID=1720 RepID=UPI0026DAA727|nr:acyltransferase [Corynebacterium sp.]MDO5029338.1 acyltransferase [Corynebacterium sp.]